MRLTIGALACLVLLPASALCSVPVFVSGRQLATVEGLDQCDARIRRLDCIAVYDGDPTPTPSQTPRLTSSPSPCQLRDPAWHWSLPGCPSIGPCECLPGPAPTTTPRPAPTPTGYRCPTLPCQPTRTPSPGLTPSRTSSPLPVATRLDARSDWTGEWFLYAYGTEPSPLPEVYAVPPASLGKRRRAGLSRVKEWPVGIWAASNWSLQANAGNADRERLRVELDGEVPTGGVYAGEVGIAYQQPGRPMPPAQGRLVELYTSDGLEVALAPYLQGTDAGRTDIDVMRAEDIPELRRRLYRRLLAFDRWLDEVVDQYPGVTNVTLQVGNCVVWPTALQAEVTFWGAILLEAHGFPPRLQLERCLAAPIGTPEAQPIQADCGTLDAAKSAGGLLSLWDSDSLRALNFMAACP